jgi:hypothetical protein
MSTENGTVHLSNETIVADALASYADPRAAGVYLLGSVNPRERKEDVPLGPLTAIVPDLQRVTLGELAYAAAWLADQDALRRAKGIVAPDTALADYAAVVADIAATVSDEHGHCSEYERLVREVSVRLADRGLPPLVPPVRRWTVNATQSEDFSLDIEEYGVSVEVSVQRMRTWTLVVTAETEDEARTAALRAHANQEDDEAEVGDWEYDLDTYGASLEDEGALGDALENDEPAMRDLDIDSVEEER